MNWKSICTLGLAAVAVAGCSDSLPTEVKQSSPPALNLAATSGTVVVKPSTMNGWLIMTEGGATGAATFGTGPGTPPVGGGSLTLSTPASDDGIAIGAALGQGKRFADITSLQYSTYRSSADPGNILAIALQFNFDADVTDSDNSWQGRLVFESYHTNPAGVPQATWQTWNPLVGKWWRTAGPTCLQSAPCTWEQVLAFWPDGGIHPTFGAVILKAGSSWAGFVGSVDNLQIGILEDVTTFDFEAETPCSATCYVDAATGNDAFGGDTPATAKKTIQAAVTQVTVGGSVIVAAGTYPEQVTISKDGLTLSGAGIGTSVLQGSSCTGTGIAITGNRTGITLRDLTVTGYQYGITTGNIGNTVSSITVEDLSASSNCIHGIWFQAGVTTDVVFNRLTASSNNAAGGAWGRGLWMINGVKTNISITDGTFNNNGLVGIDLSDGNVTGVTITGNTVIGNGDAGIGVLGAKGPGANLVANNTVTNNGRYGIEIKIPTGSGLPSGTGSVVVRDNAVSRTLDATVASDYAGIAVFRRSVGILNADQPTGVVVSGNTVSGYHRKPSGSTGDGFGIVVEGTGHVVSKNIVSDNDIGIQIQEGNTADVQNTPFFDRGNATPSSAMINRNAITSNSDLDIRNVGAPLTDATCNWYGEVSGPQASKLSGDLTTDPWLTSANLEAVCPVPPDTESPVVSNVVASPNPAAYGTPVTLTAYATDNVGVTAASYTVNGVATGSFIFGPGTPVTLSVSLGTLDVGVYDICVTAEDAAGNVSNTECTMLAVYDPTAGFVTGGGWFNSPAGAYILDPLLTGRATFGFVSKYVRGKALPTGNTQFQFKAGDLNFSSSAYEWLVVNQGGMNAQFKGTGALNGVAGYKFMVWAKDGTPDTFRIQIEDGAGTVVYDNKQDSDFGTELGGGSIVIHVPKK